MVFLPCELTNIDLQVSKQLNKYRYLGYQHGAMYLPSKVLFIYLFICLFVCLFCFVCLFVCSLVRLFIYLFIICLFVYLYMEFETSLWKARAYSGLNELVHYVDKCNH